MFIVAYFNAAGEFIGFYAPNRAKRQIYTQDRDQAQGLSRDKAHEIAGSCPPDKRAEVQPRNQA